jgi:hypothetical protein
VYPANDRVQFVDRLRDLIAERRERGGGLGVPRGREVLRGHAEADPQRGQPLLNAIVDVALDRQSVGSLYGAHASRLCDRDTTIRLALTTMRGVVRARTSFPPAGAPPRGGPRRGEL